jgi:hypothetical protein
MQFVTLFYLVSDEVENFIAFYPWVYWPELEVHGGRVVYNAIRNYSCKELGFHRLSMPFSATAVILSLIHPMQRRRIKPSIS